MNLTFTSRAAFFNTITDRINDFENFKFVRLLKIDDIKIY